jgi:hypothetical protein
MHTAIEKEKKGEESVVRRRFLLFPHHIKILFLFVTLISERGVRMK